MPSFCRYFCRLRIICLVYTILLKKKNSDVLVDAKRAPFTIELLLVALVNGVGVVLEVSIPVIVELDASKRITTFSKLNLEESYLYSPLWPSIEPTAPICFILTIAGKSVVYVGHKCRRLPPTAPHRHLRHLQPDCYLSVASFSSPSLCFLLSISLASDVQSLQRNTREACIDLHVAKDQSAIISCTTVHHILV
ncbi:hypothetical protein QVD17_39832 [Tagetes erecta]|uniref:Uncharacterized protein n=1 Tax=Tagetes erecta TaxID=13708 RepID=A0AAD8NGL7_TARER|nr:hypothetical protein QVD17_39832 [Tagetes erecta]